jgi:hypothetical protein
MMVAHISRLSRFLGNGNALGHIQSNSRLHRLYGNEENIDRKVKFSR